MSDAAKIGEVGTTVVLHADMVLNGRYRIVRSIGRGGMGTVYEVTHTNTGKRLALKLLHTALLKKQRTVERFRREARAPAHIASDHVVRVFDADICLELGGVPFIVMEYLEGCDLQEQLVQEGALPPDVVVAYLHQVASALDRAHAKNIVHRDLKPANIYIEKRDDGPAMVKVIDFGMVKQRYDNRYTLTKAGQLCGTPQYMAPEQAIGDNAAVGPATDRWALGIVAYRMLSGRLYWSAKCIDTLLRQIRWGPKSAPSETAPFLGPRFDRWFARACHRNPKKRFKSSAAMIENLSRALGVTEASEGALLRTGSARNKATESPGLDVDLDERLTGQVCARSISSASSGESDMCLTKQAHSPSDKLLALSLAIGLGFIITYSAVGLSRLRDHPGRFTTLRQIGSSTELAYTVDPMDKGRCTDSPLD